MRVWPRLRLARGASRIGYLGPAIELACPGLERRHHAPHRFVEQHADQLAEERRAELEIDEEIEPRRAARHGLEDPVVAQVFERPVEIGDVDAQDRAVKRDPALEALA